MLRDRALRLPARRDDTFKRAAREVDTGSQGRLDIWESASKSPKWHRRNTDVIPTCLPNSFCLEFPVPVPYVRPVRYKGFRPMARTNPLQFVQQTRAEIAKVIWPTRREVAMTTLMVFIMAAVLALFFSLIDFGIRSGLQGVLTYFG